MLVSYNWLKEYVDIPWGPYELADRLTMAGLEVEGVERLGPDLKNVHVGKVEAVKAHPNADKLTICSVNVGELGSYSVVCGAPNVKQGQTVAIALPGAVLPGGFKIAKTTIRDVASSGMLCSEKELGIGEDESGILILPDDLEIGQCLVEALGLDDMILDVSVYANRPDCMSMLGVAREVAAIGGTQIRYPAIDYVENDQHISELTSVQVENDKKCSRYTAKLLGDLKIGSSPLWMQMRLRAAGMRPINNVVDVTNYVMLELGQPLHAFDYNQLKENRVVVRTAKPGETIVTLDGETRTLNESMLVICDAEDPKCIAGVMGGQDSEVTEDTTTILLESANFEAVSVRRTSRKLGLASESAVRFEKGIDPHGTVFAAHRAAHLLERIAGAKAYSGIIDQSAVEDRKAEIELCPNRVNELLGVKVPKDDMITILKGLDFEVKPSSDTLIVTVPSYRRDIEIEADLVEEIARIWGFEKIPTTFPVGVTTIGGQGPLLQLSDYVREVLVGAGLYEALTYSFIRPDSNARLLRNKEPEMIKIQNPISEDLSAMRHSLLPGLLSAVSTNANRQQSRAALFEIGSVYLGEVPLKTQPLEELRLGIVLWGNRHDLNWAHPEEKFDFFDVKGLLELLFQSMPFEWETGQNDSLHPGRQGRVIYNGEEIAYYGEVHPAVLRNFRVPDRAYVAEVRLEPAAEYFGRVVEFKDLPRFPSVDRDLAVVVDALQPVGELVSLLQEEGGDILKSVTVFDVYQGKPIPADRKSVAFSLHFQADRTLVEKEVNDVMEHLIELLSTMFGAEIR